MRRGSPYPPHSGPCPTKVLAAPSRPSTLSHSQLREERGVSDRRFGSYRNPPPKGKGLRLSSVCRRSLTAAEPQSGEIPEAGAVPARDPTRLCAGVVGSVYFCWSVPRPSLRWGELSPETNQSYLLLFSFRVVLTIYFSGCFIEARFKSTGAALLQWCIFLGCQYIFLPRKDRFHKTIPVGKLHSLNYCGQEKLRMKKELRGRERTS